MIHRMLNAVERPIKRALFHCQCCGSCLLSQTHLVCPMNCPKGLRNGPCGGTLDGKCEVYTDRPCVWTHISGKAKMAEPAPIHAPFNESLFRTSSCLNFLTGADAATRKPAPFLDLPTDPRSLPSQTSSNFEKRLLKGDFVITTEIRSPCDTQDLQRTQKEIESLLPMVDALNATSCHGGIQTISSFRTAKLIQNLGGEPILQICARDVNANGFLAEVDHAHDHGIFNVLCLTGDWPAAEKRKTVSILEAHRRFFRMDSSQMIYELRHIRETGNSIFGDSGGHAGSRMFIGAAANPYTTPRPVALSRFAQKIACGADFTQTQIILDTDKFCDWLDDLESLGWRKRIHIIASIPVITKKKALEVLRRLKGIYFPDPVYSALKEAPCLEEAGIALARNIIQILSWRKAVQGFHLTNFGASAEQMLDLMRFAREINHPPQNPSVHALAQNTL